jgi:hypothetical protein
MTLTCVLAAGLVGFAAGWLVPRTAGGSGNASDVRAGGQGIPAARTEPDLARLTRTIRRLEEAVRSLSERLDQSAAGESPGPAPGGISDKDSRPSSSAPVGDRFAEWSDDELFLVARARGDDLDLIKAALRRNLSAERRAQIQLTLAAFYGKLDPDGEAERDALRDALRLVPTTTSTGAQAAWELGNLLAGSHLQSQAAPYYEAVLRDAPDEPRRMQAAYRMAWMHDLGDDSSEVALDSFRKYLADWGEKWKDYPEAIWARHRVSFLEGKGGDVPK